MRRRRALPPWVALAATLAGCAAPPVPDPAPVAAPRPPERPVATPAPPADGPDSAALVQRYKRMQAGLIARGLMRTDGGGPDTPFTAAMLARNFIQIALHDEYTRSGTTLRAQATESQLRRWDRPVRMAVHFGDSVAPDRRTQDRNQVTAYARRLARISGHDIAMAAPEAANYHVLFLSEAERRAAGPRLLALAPGLDATALRAVTDMAPDTLCAVLAISEGGSPGYTRAIAVIRDEHRDLMRRACIHEELAQGLGLANDSAHARPSIFNDDEEFALLTTHDEMLLKILYDPRLRSGMRRAEADPIVRRIASELAGGET